MKSSGLAGEFIGLENQSQIFNKAGSAIKKSLGDNLEHHI